jgi:hypothetical protein
LLYSAKELSNTVWALGKLNFEINSLNTHSNKRETPPMERVENQSGTESDGSEKSGDSDGNGSGSESGGGSSVILHSATFRDNLFSAISNVNDMTTFDLESLLVGCGLMKVWDGFAILQLWFSCA